MPVKISIVGDDFSKYSTAGLSGERTGVVCLGSYVTGEEAVRDIPKAKPDVLLVDFHLPCMNGLECVRKLKKQLPELPILMRADFNTNDCIFPSLHEGANGCVPKNLPATELVRAVKRVYQGARQGRRVFLMHFSSDRHLGKAARHWDKIAMLVSARSANISYDQDWRTVTMIGKIER